jgi:hypothetical protein
MHTGEDTYDVRGLEQSEVDGIREFADERATNWRAPIVQDFWKTPRIFGNGLQRDLD